MVLPLLLTHRDPSHPPTNFWPVNVPPGSRPFPIYLHLMMKVKTILLLVTANENRWRFEPRFWPIFLPTFKNTWRAMDCVCRSTRRSCPTLPPTNKPKLKTTVMMNMMTVKMTATTIVMMLCDSFPFQSSIDNWPKPLRHSEVRCSPNWTGRLRKMRLGCTAAPWNVKRQVMSTCYSRAVTFVCMTYPTRDRSVALLHCSWWCANGATFTRAWNFDALSDKEICSPFHNATIRNIMHT